MDRGQDVAAAGGDAQHQPIEEALRESQLRLQALFEETPSAILVVDEEGRFIDANRAALEFLECSLKELCSKKVWDFAPPGRLEICRQRHSPFLQRRTLETEYFVRGRIKTLLLNVVPVTASGRTVLYGIGHDITEHKQAEDAVRRRLDFEKAASRILSRFVGAADFDEATTAALADLGRLTRASRAYLILLREDGITTDNTHEWCAEGVSPQKDNLQGVPVTWTKWSHAKLVAGETIHITDVSQLPEEAQPERELLQSQDIKSLLALPLRVKGKYAGFIGLDNVRQTGEWQDEDIAILRLCAEMIGSALERKQEQESLREYVSLISHDLRSPLTVVMGRAELLRRDLGRRGLQTEAESAAAIAEAARRMNSLIQDLVDSARLKAGQIEMRKQTSDILALARRTVAQLDAEEQARISIHCIEQSLPVLSDPGRIERVLANLLSNALKYSPADCPVLIRCERAEDQVVVSVVDQGAGIPSEEQAHLFERFYRASAGKRTEGVGLGLYIAKLIVEAHEGRIWVESEVGRGSTFRFSLPARVANGA